MLIENVRHHVEEEEGEYFPKVRDELGRNALADLGDAMADAKKSAPTNPHPRMPDDGPANVVTGAIAGVADRVCDNVSGIAQGGVTALQDLIARITGSSKPKVSPTGSKATRSTANKVRKTASTAADGVEQTASSVKSGVTATAKTAKAGAKGTATSAKRAARATTTTAKRGATTTRHTATLVGPQDRLDGQAFDEEDRRRRGRQVTRPAGSPGLAGETRPPLSLAVA